MPELVSAHAQKKGSEADSQKKKKNKKKKVAGHKNAGGSYEPAGVANGAVEKHQSGGYSE